MAHHVLAQEDAHVLANIGRSVAAIGAFALVLIVLAVTLG